MTKQIQFIAKDIPATESGLIKAYEASNGRVAIVSLTGIQTTLVGGTAPTEALIVALEVPDTAAEQVEEVLREHAEVVKIPSELLQTIVTTDDIESYLTDTTLSAPWGTSLFVFGKTAGEVKIKGDGFSGSKIVHMKSQRGNRVQTYRIDFPTGNLTAGTDIALDLYIPSLSQFGGDPMVVIGSPNFTVRSDGRVYTGNIETFPLGTFPFGIKKRIHTRIISPTIIEHEIEGIGTSQAVLNTPFIASPEIVISLFYDTDVPQDLTKVAEFMWDNLIATLVIQPT